MVPVVLVLSSISEVSSSTVSSSKVVMALVVRRHHREVTSLGGLLKLRRALRAPHLSGVGQTYFAEVGDLPLVQLPDKHDLIHNHAGQLGPLMLGEAPTRDLAARDHP
jgi:hypothetical protein